MLLAKSAFILKPECFFAAHRLRSLDAAGCTRTLSPVFCAVIRVRASGPCKNRIYSTTGGYAPPCSRKLLMILREFTVDFGINARRYFGNAVGFIVLAARPLVSVMLHDCASQPI